MAFCGSVKMVRVVGDILPCTSGFNIVVLDVMALALFECALNIIKIGW